MPGSLNWEDPDYSENDERESDVLPLRADDRASMRLESPDFQKGKPDATVANAVVASRATSPSPAASAGQGSPMVRQVSGEQGAAGSVVGTDNDGTGGFQISESGGGLPLGFQNFAAG